MLGMDGQNMSQASAGDSVFEAGLDNFEETVMKASMSRPIVVQIYSPRSAQCASLKGVIEAIVRRAGGAVSLARVNVDAHPQLGQMLQVQSVPAVFGFFQGRPVDGLSGVLSQARIQTFVDQLVTLARNEQPGALDIPKILEVAADALVTKNFQVAQNAYSQILQQDPNNIDAYTGMIRVLIAAGEIENAQQLVQQAPVEMVKERQFEHAKTAVEMAQNSGDIEGLMQAVIQAPQDHQARLDLALALFAVGRKDEAIEHALDSLKRDAQWNDQAARKQLLQFFDAMGATDPLTAPSRRKFSAILFS